jgi:hypothetical protein
MVGRLTGPEIDGLAAALRTEHDCADAEVAWWRATVAVAGTLRSRHRTREASGAATAAADAVRRAAVAAGVGDGARDDVTMVARAAADVARGLVGGCPQVGQLLAPFARTLLVTSG